MDEKTANTEEQWREKLTGEQFCVLREKGTERAFTGKYWNCKTKGTYRCAGCGLELFSSETKYNSGSGWPSFWKPKDEGNVKRKCDDSHGMTRTEITCARCGGHLGHVFDDGPEPTGLRYCVNSASLKLDPSKAEE